MSFNLQGYATIEESRNKDIANAIVLWYFNNKRQLPWRTTKEPYNILVSEVMAQQTRITALLPYYNRFVEAFPTVRHLASAPIDQVLKLWEGLGYYRRAHNLHKAAQMIVYDFCGQYPQTEKEWLTLPGVGEYTAGAIMSISYGVPVPAVDGNVLRVFSRLENNHLDIADTKTKTELSSYLRLAMPKRNVSEFTQGLMELGALVCLPKNPLCDQCPICFWCKAKECNQQQNLPIKGKKKPQKHINKTVVLVVDQQNRVLLRKRTETLLQGLHEFLVYEQVLTQKETLAKLEILGFRVLNCLEMGASSHVFTHLVWNMQGFLCCVKHGKAPKGFRWVAKKNLQALAFPTAYKKYTSFAMGHL